MAGIGGSVVGSLQVAIGFSIIHGEMPSIIWIAKFTFPE
jgi:hypothetical protein